MTTERETVAVGSCPTCGGPAQFIGPVSHANGCTARIGGVCICSETTVRHVALPNIDEDLGGGWRLSGIEWDAHESAAERPAWRARAWKAWKPSFFAGRSFERAFGDTPAAAYLALRTAIEARS